MSKVSNNAHFFYISGRLTTVIDSDEHYSIFRSTHTCLAQHNTTQKTVGLFATDSKNSPLKEVSTQKISTTYSPYGLTLNPPSTVGFNGENFKSEIRAYMLINGRIYSPILMRFFSSDTFSPFAEGGLNSYAFCGNDPINFIDSSGHMREPAQKIINSRKMVKGRVVNAKRNEDKSYNLQPFSDSEAQILKAEVKETESNIAKLKQRAASSGHNEEQLKVTQNSLNQEIKSSDVKLKEITDRPNSSQSAIMQKRKTEIWERRQPLLNQLAQVESRLLPFKRLHEAEAELLTLNEFLRGT